MDYEQLLAALIPKNMPCAASSVEVSRPPSISFLEMKVSRKGYKKKIVELQKAIETMNWPGQNNRSSIAGGSRAEGVPVYGHVHYSIGDRSGAEPTS